MVLSNGLFGAGHSKNKTYLGHGDFSCSRDNGGLFNYNEYDENPKTEPMLHAAGHFRPIEESDSDVAAAIAKNCSIEDFQEAMHRGQDFFSHWKKGFRWEPGNILRPCNGFGHFCYDAIGLSPDDDEAAWADAEEWTKERLKEWNEKCGCKGGGTLCPV